MQKVLLGLAVLVAAFAAAPQAGAQTFPTKPIRLVVPFPPGGGNDIIARLVTPPVEAQIKQPIVIDNRAGANGIIGSQVVSKSEPDGYTLLHTSSAFSINPSVYKKLPFDIFTDFTPVANVAVGTGYVLVVSAKLPIKTVAELIAFAKEKKKILYGSPGTGNPIQLCTAAFGVAAGIDLEGVQHRGTAPALTAVIEGSIPFMFAPPGSVVGHVKGGLLRAIGFSGNAPSAEFPDVPLVRDTVKNFRFDGVWQGWFAPPKTPPQIVDFINRQVREASNTPKVVEALRKVGYEPQNQSPAEFAAFVKQSAADMAIAVKAAGIDPQ